MFKPEYRITSYFVSCCENIASIIAFIKRSDVKLALQIRLERELVNRSVHSSTWIEGNRLSFDQVVALASNKHVFAQNDQKQEVNNCIKAMQWCLKNKGKALTEKRLISLYRMITKGLLPVKHCAQYRKVQNYIVNARNDVIFTPPAPGKVRKRMADLLNWIKTNEKEHAIIRSALFHHEFVTIHPFVDGNGRVARAAAQLLLYENNFDPLHTLSLDEYFASDRGRYYNMIHQARDLDGDFTYWIDYIAEGIMYSVQKVTDRLKTVRRGQNIKRISLTPKQEELLQCISKYGSMGSKQIGEKMKINRSRVNQLISPLIKSCIIKKEGEARTVRYSLA